MTHPTVDSSAKVVILEHENRSRTLVGLSKYSRVDVAMRGKN